MTYQQLGIPYAREYYRGTSPKYHRLLKAHAREMARINAEPRNWGWCIDDTGICSKCNNPDGGAWRILTTNIRNGAINHKWSRYEDI